MMDTFGQNCRKNPTLSNKSLYLVLKSVVGWWLWVVVVASVMLVVVVEGVGKVDRWVFKVVVLLVELVLFMVVRGGSAHGRDPVGRRCFVHDVARGVVW
jgi:hypothetical protein